MAAWETTETETAECLSVQDPAKVSLTSLTT